MERVGPDVQLGFLKDWGQLGADGCRGDVQSHFLWGHGGLPAHVEEVCV